MKVLILIIVSILLLYTIIIVAYNITIPARFNGNSNYIFIRKYRIKRTVTQGVLNYTFQVRKFLLWRDLLLPRAEPINPYIPNVSFDVKLIYETYNTTSDLDIIDKFKRLKELCIIKYRGCHILRTIDNHFVNLDKYEYKYSSSRYIADYKLYESAIDLDALKAKIDERVDNDLVDSTRYIYPD